MYKLYTYTYSVFTNIIRIRDTTDFCNATLVSEYSLGLCDSKIPCGQNLHTDANEPHTSQHSGHAL